jgi:hypothetical protein
LHRWFVSRSRAGVRIVDAKDAEVKREDVKEFGRSAIGPSMHHHPSHRFLFSNRVAIAIYQSSFLFFLRVLCVLCVLCASALRF